MYGCLLAFLKLNTIFNTFRDRRIVLRSCFRGGICIPTHMLCYISWLTTNRCGRTRAWPICNWIWTYNTDCDYTRKWQEHYQSLYTIKNRIQCLGIEIIAINKLSDILQICKNYLKKSCRFVHFYAQGSQARPHVFNRIISISRQMGKLCSIFSVCRIIYWRVKNGSRSLLGK
jgi:hypothetical protein